MLYEAQHNAVQGANRIICSVLCVRWGCEIVLVESLQMFLQLIHCVNINVLHFHILFVESYKFSRIDRGSY